MNKKLEMVLDGYEVELCCSISPFIKGGRASKFDPPDPDEGGEIEDLYVGVIIKGCAIDITDKLNSSQRKHIEALCIERAEDEYEDV